MCSKCKDVSAMNNSVIMIGRILQPSNEMAVGVVVDTGGCSKFAISSLINAHIRAASSLVVASHKSSDELHAVLVSRITDAIRETVENTGKDISILQASR